MKKLLFALSSLLLLNEASAQVVLYKDCTYAGKVASFAEGSYPLSALTAAGGLGKDVSSLSVPNGYKITLYAEDNYLGASLAKTGDDICLADEGWNDRLSSFKVEKIPPPAPPATWQEHWFEHNQLLANVYYDNDVAVYYDSDMSRAVTWPNAYLAKVWRYTKSVYGSFGGDSRLFAVYHNGKYSGGHPSTYYDASHDYRNAVDVGPGPWTSGTGNDLDLVTHEVGHLVEGASKGVHGSPAFGLWGDSKWNEIYIYDVYKGLNMTGDLARWYNLMLAASDNFPRRHTYWFRDWFYPVYSKYGGSAVLNRYFQLLAQYYPQSGGNYATGMNWGEFVHFWSGAAGTDLKPLATLAFGWNATWEAQLAQARSQFPLVTYTVPADKRVVAVQQNTYFGGYSVGLAPGTYTSAALVAAGAANRDISSLRVPAGYTVTLYDADNFTGASLVKTADDSTLIDDGWNDRAASLRVSAVASANVAPTVELTSPRTADYQRGEALSFAADAADDDGTVTQVAFYSDNTLLFVDKTAPYQYTYRNASVGVHRATAVATDNSGVTTTSVERDYQVLSDPPTLTVTAPLPNATYSGQDPILISVKATPNGGTVARVEIYDNGFHTELLATLTTAPYTYSWSTASPGSHDLHIHAASNDGATADEYVTIFVEDPTNKTIPGKIQAENYFQMAGVSTEHTADAGGGRNVSYLDAGDYLDYNVNVQAAGTYTAQFRVASSKATGKLQLLAGTTVLATVAVPNTGRGQTWTTVSAPVALAAGNQNLRVAIVGGGFNFNWMNFGSAAARGAQAAAPLAAQPATARGEARLVVCPNPAANTAALVGLNTFPATVSVYDARGALVQRTELAAPADAGRLNVSALRAGFYVLRATSRAGVQTQRFVKE